MMDSLPLMLLGLAVLLVIAWQLRPTSLGRATERAMRTGELEPLAVQIRKKKAGEERATAFNRATRRMWDGYQRELATAFVALMAPDLTDTSIVQYWMKQILEVEPEVARQCFDDRFLDQFYRPEVARKCGSFG